SSSSDGFGECSGKLFRYPRSKSLTRVCCCNFWRHSVQVTVCERAFLRISSSNKPFARSLTISSKDRQFIGRTSMRLFCLRIRSSSQHLDQLISRAMQPRSHRTDCASKRNSSFFVAHFCQLAQHQNFPKLRRQIQDRLPHLFHPLAMQHVCQRT